MSHDCIFCKIVKGEIPATRVYEDSQALAFMDIGPVVKGHVLVIPKSHHNPLMETPVEVLQNLIVVVRTIARAQMKGLQAKGISVAQANGKAANQVVPHIHFHVIPRFTDDGFHGTWIAQSYDSMEEMNSYAGRIRQALV